MRPRLLGSILAALSLATVAVHPAQAGEIDATWTAVSGASGYHVYYGSSSGAYSAHVTTGTNSAVITGLQDCQTYYVAVKAYNASGESASFSNEISGWARPTVTSVTPSTALQGDQVVMDVYGTNYQTGAAVDLGNPNVVTTSMSVLSCSHIQLLLAIEPTAKKVHPAKVGGLDLSVSNPDTVFGMKSKAFQVLINPARFDINQSDASTNGRIDGKDTIYLASDFGLSDASVNYDPDKDFDGDGWIDGNDLAYIATNLGKCWTPSSKTWTLTACPSNLR